MFKMSLSEPRLAPPLFEQACHELSRVLDAQRQLRQSDVEKKCHSLHVQLRSGRAGDRSTVVDLECAMRAAKALEVMQPEELAVKQLPLLLRHVGGLIETIDLGSSYLGLRIRNHEKASSTRAVVLPEPSRRLRVQMQPYGNGTPPEGPNPCRQTCLGAHGDSFVDFALDQLDLPTLALTLVSYVRTN